MDDAIILCARRTPIGKLGGSLSHIPVHHLGASAITAVLKDASPLVTANDIQEVYVGQVLTAGAGMNPARQASLMAGLPQNVTASTINMVCGSGLKAIALGAQSIRCGDRDIVVAAGMESMSQAPHLIRLRSSVQSSSGSDTGSFLPTLPKFGDMPLVDSLISEGLTDPVLRCKMGNTAEFVAHVHNIGRMEQDLFALRSHLQWGSAASTGRFVSEVTPVNLDGKSSCEVDELPRPTLTIDKLSKLPPVFELPKLNNSVNGELDTPTVHQSTVTAGNCSGLNDGAAAVLLVSSNFFKSRALSTRGLTRVVSWAQSAGRPELMGIEVVNGVKQALSKANWSIDTVDFWEINEAFAVTTIVAIKQLGIPDWESRVNVNGGAIAIGHPLGASGARLIVTLSHQLANAQLKNPSKQFRGVATACIGGGQSIAMCIESIMPQ